ncbi:prolipoprotein diacylglyceryl transferase [Erysipelothrix sp. HDW6A]|uniref:prolipoprotein diacylglyceryl transferase n=1 Tax=Erysipelothrix sp. HDW6A TaxID=2714928 RepID=UPI00140ABBB9|nr:prolipoprotein diacylglyceryl transferase [Erysipelothrix sp. HDW6A]QIK56427.1 prolipoprotein diacylglyceryl transferase [Erysipelothrix sp. HDW6A]
MQFFPNVKTFVQLGPLEVTWYAVLIVTGAYIAYMISRRNLVKVGYDIDDIDNIFIGSLLFGFPGARIWYVMFSDLQYYLQDPIQIFNIRQGGLAIQGGLIAGAIFCYIYMKKRRINFMQAADLIVPNILIAQALGRWGNFINQEAFGGPVPETFFNYFPSFIKDMMFIGGEYHHPTFLYESVANLIGWVLIVLVLKRVNRNRRGDLTYAYLMWYGVTRFFIEGLRTDSLYFFNTGIRMAQLTSIVFVIIGMVGYFGVFRKIFKQAKPIILWDFDGTIADTHNAIASSFKKLFAEHKQDYDLTDEQILEFMGPTLNEVMEKHFPGNVEEMTGMYRSYSQEFTDMIQLMPDVEASLRYLQEQGYRQGIVSNRVTPSLEQQLLRLNIQDYFEVVVGADQFEKSKPSPDGIDKALELMGADHGGVIYIGDTPTDMEAGRRAGSFTIAYVSDKIREETLNKSNPNRIISDYTLLPTILEEDHEWTTTMM